MLTYDFAKAQGPLYEYIYQCIKDDIMEGNLRQGEKLPSKRSFAKNNGISTITIQNAYDQLISEGYIYTIPQKGYYVAKLEGMKKVQRESKVAGKANIIIWPDLNVGNVGVKLIQQFGHADAYGPMMQGFNKVVCDCSRGAPVSEIKGNIVISAVRASGE